MSILQLVDYVLGHCDTREPAPQVLGKPQLMHRKECEQVQNHAVGFTQQIASLARLFGRTRTETDVGRSRSLYIRARPQSLIGPMREEKEENANRPCRYIRSAWRTN